jgi:hypothetical protein
MPRASELVVELTEEQRRELESWQRSTTMRAGLVRRGRVVLLRAQGVPILRIAREVGLQQRHVRKWVSRFREQGIDGLSDKPGRGRKAFFPSGSCCPCSQAGLRTA